MKLTLSRAAEFMQATGELRPRSGRRRILHRFAHLAAGRVVLRGPRRAAGRPRLCRSCAGQGRGRRRGANEVRLRDSRDKSRLLVVDDPLTGSAAAGRGGAAAVGQAADRRDRIGGQDDDQGNHRARAGDAASRAEVAGQSEQSFRHAAAIAQAGAGARDCGHRDGHVARRRDHGAGQAGRSRTAAW